MGSDLIAIKDKLTSRDNEATSMESDAIATAERRQHFKQSKKLQSLFFVEDDLYCDSPIPPFFK